VAVVMDGIESDGTEYMVQERASVARMAGDECDEWKYDRGCTRRIAIGRER